MPARSRADGPTVRRALVCLLLLGTTACGPDGPAAPDHAGAPASGTPAATATAGLQGSLLQFRRDVPARRLQVRLVAADPGLVVEALDLVVPGLPATPADPRDAVLRPATPLDLPVVAGHSDCATPPAAPTARVRLRDAAGVRREETVPLDDGGLVRRLHDADCAEQALAAQVALEVAGVRPVQTDRGPALDVLVRLRRAGGSDPVRVTGTRPNTVYAVTAAGPLPTLDDAPSVDLELRLVPARCDVHALGESHRTSLIGLVLQLGDADPRPVVLTPDDAVRRQLETFAVETCRAGPG